jgi:hypothetical protein
VPANGVFRGTRSLLRSYGSLTRGPSIDRQSLRDWQPRCSFRELSGVCDRGTRAKPIPIEGAFARLWTGITS